MYSWVGAGRKLIRNAHACTHARAHERAHTHTFTSYTLTRMQTQKTKMPVSCVIDDTFYHLINTMPLKLAHEIKFAYSTFPQNHVKLGTQSLPPVMGLVKIPTSHWVTPF